MGLKEAMVHLNEDYAVRDDEVSHVREAALALMGAEKKVTTQQMRLAIATWYSNVERKETPEVHLAKRAAQNATHKVFNLNPFLRWARCHIDHMTVVMSSLVFF